MAPPFGLVLEILSNVDDVTVMLDTLSIVRNGLLAFTSSKVQSVSERDEDNPLALMMVVPNVTSSVVDVLMLTVLSVAVPPVTEKRGTFNLFPSSTFRMNERSVNETVDALRRKTASPEVTASTDL